MTLDLQGKCLKLNFTYAKNKFNYLQIHFYKQSRNIGETIHTNKFSLSVRQVNMHQFNNSTLVTKRLCSF